MRVVCYEVDERRKRDRKHGQKSDEKETRDRDGDVTIKTDGEENELTGKLGANGNFSMLAGKAYPSKPVKLGDEWKSHEKIASPDGSGEIETTTVSKFVGIEIIEGSIAYKVSVKVSSKSLFNTTQEVMVFIDKTNGKVALMIGSIDLEVFGTSVKCAIDMKCLQPELKPESANYKVKDSSS